MRAHVRRRFIALIGVYRLSSCTSESRAWTKRYPQAYGVDPGQLPRQIDEYFLNSFKSRQISLSGHLYTFSGGAYIHLLATAVSSGAYQRVFLDNRFASSGGDGPAYFLSDVLLFSSGFSCCIFRDCDTYLHSFDGVSTSKLLAMLL